MIDLNVRALTDFSLAFLDSLERRKGGILNVASIAGFLPGPGMAVYYATKAYVISFSEALHQELKPRGVRVTVLCPGPVPTEFQARAGISREVFPPLLTRSAERVAGRLSRPQGGTPDGHPGLGQPGCDGADLPSPAQPCCCLPTCATDGVSDRCLRPADVRLEMQAEQAGHLNYPVRVCST